MRLEAETNSATVDHNVVANAAAENFSLEANDRLREGIKAAQNGDREKAREALLRSTELDPTSESAWLWLASISEYPEELLVFLNNVLDLNPLNARAIEWMKATKALLSKTFVQRGMDAADSGNNEFAVQCFDQALEHDQTNTAAWFWLADLSASNEGKISYLEKVLELDPENITAREAHQKAKNEINRSVLAEARSAAVAGRKSDAHELLDAFIAENPEAEDGWILRAHLADGFAEKIAAFERVLSINPDNLTAKSGLESLRSIIEMVEPNAVSESLSEPEVLRSDEAEVMENTAYAIEQERTHDTAAVPDKSPTQELVFPEAASEMAERSEMDQASGVEMPAAAPVSEGVDWSMNTVAFTFAFPGGETPSSDPSPEPESFATESFEFAVDPNASNGDQEDDQLIEAAKFDPESTVTFSNDTADVEVAGEVATQENDFQPSSEHRFEPVLEEYKLQAVVAEPEAETYHVEPEMVVEPVEFFESSIPMPPPADFDMPSSSPTGYETTVVRDETPSGRSVNPTVCGFCGEENQGQVFTCGNCLSTLTLSDLEMLLANTHADKEVVRAAVERMESELNSREHSESELTLLGIGHLNLRNFDEGYGYLQKASALNPNNVVLSSQVNLLHIRLEEIKQKAEEQDQLPKGKSILVVDDSATVRKLIAGKLEKSGHEVFCAADGVEAIEQLNSMVPDLILLDITMPRMDGYQVCKVIRSKDSTKDVPVVMISGKDGFFDKVRGRMAGTTGYITKPFGPETLMKAVETYMRGEVL
ncbi:MAG: response regulator [Pyrinomonadaceae bacterium]|nr:response regulator [Pyrinomonadaceae bacterium]